MGNIYGPWCHWKAQRAPAGHSSAAPFWFCANVNTDQSFYAVCDDFGNLVGVA